MNSTIAVAEMISFLALCVSLFSMMDRKELERSSRWLRIGAFLELFWLFTEIIAFECSDGVLPKIVMEIVLLLSYVCGCLTIVTYIYYCKEYIGKDYKINRWLFDIPAVVGVFTAGCVTVLFLEGKLVVFSGNAVVEMRGVPLWVELLYISLLLYISIVTFCMRKVMKMSLVAIVGLYALLPILTIIISIATEGDLTPIAGAFAAMMLISWVQNTTMKRVMEAENAQREERYNIIQSMSSIYFAAYYIDLVNDTYAELKSKSSIREVIKPEGRAQECLFLASEKLIVPEYSEVMRTFVDLSTLNERLKDSNAVSCEYIGVTTGWSMAFLIAGDRDENGNLLHVFYAARTIYDEKAREDKQKAEIKEYNDIIAAAGLGVWHIILKEGQKPRMQANDKMRELIGIKGVDMTDEEIYDSWYSRICPEALDSVSKSVDEMVAGEFSENTYLWNHPTLGNIYVRCGGTAQKLPDGSVVLSGYHYDVNKIVIEEQKQKEELAKARSQAENASKAKSTFLFNMSHDIRTPMNAIIGFTDLLETHMDDPEKAKDYISKIRSSSDFLLALINNVLEVSRIESGKAILDETIDEVGNISHDIEIIFSERMKAKGITFTYSIENFTKFIYVDTVKMKEIFLNLVSNAYKYTPNGGSVSINVRELPCKDEGYALFRTVIKDTGIGMAREYLPHLFEEFSREKTVTEDGIEGTGLGMPIVKRLVDLMNGTIEVESEQGKGTTFTLTIPYRIAEIGNMPSFSNARSEVMRFEGKRILIAEDNDLNAEIAQEILEDAGFLTERAEDGIICIDMLQKAEEGYYDLILMDVQMPHMDGYKATQMIRCLPNEAKKNIPIVAMTANAFEEDKQHAIEIGMNAHIAKPIKVKEFIETLAEIIQ